MELTQWADYTATALGVPSAALRITRLTGGVVNSTVRLEILHSADSDTITRRNGPRQARLAADGATSSQIPTPGSEGVEACVAAVEGDDETHRGQTTGLLATIVARPVQPGLHCPSCVLKYAPDHMPGDKATPLSTFRQTAEMRALEHLANDESLSSALDEGSVKVPSVLCHDATNHILWITDLGRLTTLTDYLLGAELPLLQTPALEADAGAGRPVAESGVCPNGSVSSPDLHVLDERIAQSAGERMGRTLGALHLAALGPSDELLARFTDPNPSGPSMAAYLSSCVTRLLRTHGSESDATDADLLATRIGLGLGTPPADGVKIWGMVDLWPGSVLLGRTASEADSSQVHSHADDADSDISQLRLALVDWEFAGPAHPGADVGMLLSHIAANCVEAEYSPSKSDARVSAPIAAAALARARCDVFADSLAKAYTQRAPQLLTPSFTRQALCAYGREMVTAADFRQDKLSDEGKKKVVSEGATCLRAAGESEEDMDASVVGTNGVAVYLGPVG